MALIGNMINQAFAGNPATVNYAMFTSAFSMFTLFYLVPASFNTDWSGHPIILIVLDTLNAIFFLTSGIALAARLECHDCSNDVRLHHNPEICNNDTNPCRNTPATTKSPTAPKAAPSVAARLKLPWHSFGLPGLGIPPP